VAESRIEELRRRVAGDPGSRLFAQLAEETRKAGDLAEAVRVARAGLAVHPGYPAALLTLGRALIDSGDGEGARTALQEALTQAPENILASRFLGQALEAVGDLAAALRQYRVTLKMAPGDRQLEERMQGLERRLAQGERAVPAAVVGGPAGLGGAGSPALRGEAAAGAIGPAAARAAEEPPEAAGRAIGSASEGGETTEGDAPPFASPTLAELYLRQGFAERAIEVYRQVVAERPGDERARTRLGELASLQARDEAGGADDTPEARRRALQRTIAGLEVLLGVARRR
jgi:tetratricopeptide (TPR) repeat protein